MTESNDESDAALVADLSEARTQIDTLNGDSIDQNIDDGVIEGPSKKRKLKSKGRTPGETSDARRESHKIIEQKRRQKINDKINELRELLNYPDGSQNKAVVLQAAVDNIKNLKTVCSKLISSHRQLQEEYLHVIAENERLRKSTTESQSMTEEKINIKQTLPNQMGFPQMDIRLPDPMGFLYDEPLLAVLPRSHQVNVPNIKESYHNGVISNFRDGFQPNYAFGQDMGDAESNRQALNRLLYNGNPDVQ